MNYRKVIEYIFFGVISWIGTTGVAYIGRISETLARLETEFKLANQRIDLRFQGLEDRVSKIENVKGK